MNVLNVCSIDNDTIINASSNEYWIEQIKDISLYSSTIHSNNNCDMLTVIAHDHIQTAMMSSQIPSKSTSNIYEISLYSPIIACSNEIDGLSDIELKLLREQFNHPTPEHYLLASILYCPV